MARTVRGLTLLTVLLGTLLFAGCPAEPVLWVGPTAIAFNASMDKANFRIINTGAGSLDWELIENEAWMSLALSSAPSKQEGSLTGSTTTETTVIEILLDRSQLPTGTVQGEIQLLTNAGNQSIAVSVNQTSPAKLLLSQNGIYFDPASKTAMILVFNDGLEALNYEASINPDTPWLSASPLLGVVANQDDYDEVNINVDRTNLVPGNYESWIDFTSNGGDQRLEVILVVPPFSVSPDSIDFGDIIAPSEQYLSITSGDTEDMNIFLSASTDDGSPWLTLSVTEAVLGETPLRPLLTANPTGLTHGAYTGDVTISTENGAYEYVIPVTMQVQSFVIDKNQIDFGTITSSLSDSLTLSSLTGDPIEWSASVPVADALWLTVEPLSGSVTNTELVTVSADPNMVDPGSYASTISFTYEGGVETVAVTMARPKPATLTVQPPAIDFGISRVEELLAIWNSGIGTIDWRINTNDPQNPFPDWLTVYPLDALGVAEGTVSGDQTDSLKLIVDRSKVPADELAPSFSFTVEAFGDTTEGVLVSVEATVPVFPALEIEADGVDILEQNPFINFEPETEEKTFFLLNTGAGDLTWSIPLEELPSWITSVDPASGTIPPNEKRSVKISVNRDGLTYLGDQYELNIETNDPNNETAILIVEIVVPKVRLITVRPSKLAFGVNQITDYIEVANNGDPETVLNFQISATKDWIALYPRTGSSLGTSSNIKDWQVFSVSIDRSQLTGEGASGKILVESYINGTDGPEPDPDVESMEIEITVEAPKLTIETAMPRLRMPSLVRYPILMRNLLYQALPISESRLASVGEKFVVYEKDIALELTETNQFLTSASRIRGNVLIMLDYSGSMLAAAREVSDESVANAPDPIQALYARSIPLLIDELPENYAVGIVVFNERTVSDSDLLRVIREYDTAPTFIRDKDRAKERFNSISVLDNGATEFLPAVSQASGVLSAADSVNGLEPFDDADVHAIVCFTDGRLTTPPGTIADTQTILVEDRSRFMCVGWGGEVSVEPLIQLTSVSGGHYYATQNEPTGEVNSFGSPITIPVVDEMVRWCTTDLDGDGAEDNECSQSIGKDFKSMTVFSYVTLNEEGNVSMEGRITFDDPNDQDSECIPEQGLISGSFAKSQLAFDEIVGDTRLGQIVFETDGISDEDEAIIYIRAEYIPRNISQFTFDIHVEDNDGIELNFDLAQVAETEGGIISKWTDDNPLDDDYTYRSLDEPLQYGEFGNLLRVTVSNISEPFTLFFEVLDPVDDPDDPDSKRFLYPSSIVVDAERSFVSVRPTPSLSFNPLPDSTDPFTFNLNEDTDIVEIEISNSGGSDEESGIGLYYYASLTDDSVGIEFDTTYGYLYSSSVLLSPRAQRELEPGFYEGTIEFSYVNTFTGAVIEGEPVIISFEVLEPELTIIPDIVDFEEALESSQIEITNSGQSTMNWSVDSSTQPSWLSFSSLSGVLGPDESQTVTCQVNRDGLDPGAYLFNVRFEAEYDQEDIVQFLMLVGNP